MERSFVQPQKRILRKYVDAKNGVMCEILSILDEKCMKE
jgi:hypothetical protein